MDTSDEVLATIYAAIDDHNQQAAGENGAASLTKSTQTVLFGKGAEVDSIALVNLILEVETLLDERLGVSVPLADGQAMSERNSPFRTVETLKSYILDRMANA